MAEERMNRVFYRAHAGLRKFVALADSLRPMLDELEKEGKKIPSQVNTKTGRSRGGRKKAVAPAAAKAPAKPAKAAKKPAGGRKATGKLTPVPNVAPAVKTLRKPRKAKPVASTKKPIPDALL